MSTLLYMHLRSHERTILHRNVVNSLRRNGLLILETFHSRQPKPLRTRKNWPSVFNDIATMRHDFQDLQLLELLEGNSAPERRH